MNEKVKVLGIIGSPRKNGNTETIVDNVLAGAKEEGANTDKIILNDLTIGYCQGCNSCSESGQCKINDDMTIINEKMRQNSIFIFGTPIYFWGPTGQFKTFTDRLLATSRQGYIKNKKVVLVIPLGGPESVARHTIGMITDSVNYLNADIVTQIISPQTMERDDLKEEVLEKAREIGRELIRNTGEKNETKNIR